MSNEACKSKLRSVVKLSMHLIAQKTGWQSFMRSYIMPGLQAYLVQELNVNTVEMFLQLSKTDLSKRTSIWKKNDDENKFPIFSKNVPPCTMSIP